MKFITVEIFIYSFIFDYLIIFICVTDKICVIITIAALAQ